MPWCFSSGHASVLSDVCTAIVTDWGRTLALQVAALRVLAGLLEASAEGMDAFRVRDGFNVLYHALAQGDDALQQVKSTARDGQATASISDLRCGGDSIGWGREYECAVHPIYHCATLVRCCTSMELVTLF